MVFWMVAMKVFEMELQMVLKRVLGKEMVELMGMSMEMQMVASSPRFVMEAMMEREARNRDLLLAPWELQVQMAFVYRRLLSQEEAAS